MGLDVYFQDDVAHRLEALSKANARALRWARDFGANHRDVAIAEAAYQAALVDVGVSFGLSRPALLVILGEVHLVDGDGFYQRKERR